MFIVKGFALGIAMFVVFSILYMWASGMIGGGGGVTPDVTRSVLTRNVLYWTAGALMLALGCVIMAIWPVKVSP